MGDNAHDERENVNQSRRKEGNIPGSAPFVVRSKFESLVTDVNDSHAKENHGGDSEDFFVFNGFRPVHV